MALRNPFKAIRSFGGAGGSAKRLSPGASTAESVTTGLLQREFNMHFQPVLSLESGALIGAEALLSWDLPGAAEPAPARQFMSKVMRASVLDQMIWSVVGPACEFARNFQIEGRRSLTFGVNLSATQLADGIAALASVSEALATSQLPPWCLLLEIPEQVLLDGDSGLPATLARLATLDVGIVIDDFWGSDRAAEIIDTPGLRGVKLDLRANTNSEATRDQLVVAAQLAHARSLTVTAKRVESLFEIEFARELGCDFLQGHAYGRPMTAEAFRAFARRMTDSDAEVDPVA